MYCREETNEESVMHRCFVVLCTVTFFLSSCSSSQVDIDAEKKAIRATWDAISQAFVSKDWVQYSSLFDQGADLQMVHPVERDWISGFEDFQARYEPLITAEGEWKFETTRFDANIGPGARVAWAMIEISFDPAYGDPITNWELVVFKKNEGQWRVTSAMAASLPSL